MRFRKNIGEQEKKGKGRCDLMSFRCLTRMGKIMSE